MILNREPGILTGSAAAQPGLRPAYRTHDHHSRGSDRTVGPAPGARAQRHRTRLAAAPAGGAESDPTDRLSGKLANLKPAAPLGWPGYGRAAVLSARQY
eukprot:596367-Hanusia_phi.AAC.3